MIRLSARQRARTQRGFTLIELLVVIAIIAILAAILFPVFAKAREKAHQTACSNHQRQLAIGILSGVQDNSETFPLPGEWIEAVGLSSDPKVFNCPTNSHKGVPSDPDYGMNAFLYDVDPDTGGIVACAMGNIEDPTTVELTTDIKGLSSKGAADTDPLKDLKDKFISPFPNTFTVTGYGDNGEMRHNGSAIVSYVDGHVKMIKAAELTGTSPYSLPRSSGRLYIDFSLTKNYADAYRQLHAAVGYHDAETSPVDNGIGMNVGQPGDVLLGVDPLNTYSPSVGWKITGPGSMAFGRADAHCFVPTGGTNHTLMLDCEVASGTTFTFGAVGYGIAGPVAPDAGTLDLLSDGKAIVVDTVNNFVQGGSMTAWSNGTYAGYPTALARIPLPGNLKGKRFPMKAGTRKFKIELTTDYAGTTIPFPTDNSQIWMLDATHTFSAQAAKTGRTKWRVITPSETFTYEGPMIGMWWNFNNISKMITVQSGSMTIKRILFSGT
ncbi:MAG: prepilin-type N-terminal cleavage/methylation domain-containing protein [Armatimonadota bacterium]